MTAFSVEHRDRSSDARSAVLRTAHGDVSTPAFVGVATRASIKAVEPAAVADIGIQMLISNTYHLYLRPGADTIGELGGLHGFSGWHRPTMTDSGGFQVFSLGVGKTHGVGKVASIFPDNGTEPRHSSRHPNRESLVQLSEEGATFRSIIDGSQHVFTPESVIMTERRLGADVILPLDECTSPLHDAVYTRAAMERTHRWAQRAIAAYETTRRDPSHPNPQQALFGIVQGGAYPDLRKQSARFIGSLPFSGYAIGGSLGRSKADMLNVLEWTTPLLGREKPRHLLGIGEIDDIFDAVLRGVDTLDCAAPTRLARNGSVFLKGAPRHRINLRNAAYARDERPIDETCDCPACRRHSRAYLRHLCRAGELSFYRLATLHNLRFLVRLMHEIRKAIHEDRLSLLAAEWRNAGVS